MEVALQRSMEYIRGQRHGCRSADGIGVTDSLRVTLKRSGVGRDVLISLGDLGDSSLRSLVQAGTDVVGVFQR